MVDNAPALKQAYATAKAGSTYLAKVQSQQVFKIAPKGLAPT